MYRLAINEVHLIIYIFQYTDYKCVIWLIKRTIIDIFLIRNIMVNFNIKAFRFTNNPLYLFDQFQYKSHH